MGRRFLAAEWRHLVMLNYQADPELLHPLVPRGTELDPWRGTHYVSVVGFLFRSVRVLGIPIPRHRTFEEVNLRFYIRRRDPEAGASGWRRGVCFIKEVVPRVAVAAVARWLYNENYVARAMRSDIRLPDLESAGAVTYEWAGATGWNRVRARFEGEPAPWVPGSEEEFITEHYWGYVPQRDGSTAEYRVVHPPWRVWRAVSSELSGDVAGFYGKPWGDVLAAPPRSAFVAEGSAIEVYRGERIREFQPRGGASYFRTCSNR
jgi:uncharacterized protein YqjF (DUF2071 family)